MGGLGAHASRLQIIKSKMTLMREDTGLHGASYVCNEVYLYLYIAAVDCCLSAQCLTTSEPAPAALFRYHDFEHHTST